MTQSALYPIILDIAFDKQSIFYLVFDSCACRKEAGPMLCTLLEHNNIDIVKATVSEWTVNIDNHVKYIRMLLPIDAHVLYSIGKQGYEKVLYVDC
jgi:hypothetical protein